MEFKSSQVAFKSKNNFTDDMKRFVIDEAARFTTDGNEAASASLDEMAEKAVRLSAEKNKRGVEEQKQILHEIKEKKQELKKESINPSVPEKIARGSSYSTDTGNSVPASNSTGNEKFTTEKFGNDEVSEKEFTKDTEIF